MNKIPEMPIEVAQEAVKMNLTARDLRTIWNRYHDWVKVGAHVANMRWVAKDIMQTFNGVDVTKEQHACDVHAKALAIRGK